MIVRVFGGFILFVFYQLFASIPLIASPVGRFLEVIDVSYYAYPDQQTCEEAKGDWDEALNICWIQGLNFVEIKKTSRLFNRYSVWIQLIGRNGHMCEFKGKSNYQDKHIIIASTHSSNSRASSQSICKMKIQFFNENHIKIQAVDFSTCESLCGAGVYFDELREFERNK